MTTSSETISKKTEEEKEEAKKFIKRVHNMFQVKLEDLPPRTQNYVRNLNNDTLEKWHDRQDQRKKKKGNLDDY